MTTYPYDVFSTLDGVGTAGGDWAKRTLDGHIQELTYRPTLH